MILPQEFYYAVISAVIGILWTNKLNFDCEGRLHFKGRFIGFYLGFIIWLIFFGITYFLVAGITKPLVDTIIHLVGPVIYVKDSLLIILTFIVFYLVYKIKIKSRTKEGMKVMDVVHEPVKAVKNIPKKIEKIKNPEKKKNKKK